MVTCRADAAFIDHLKCTSFQGSFCLGIHHLAEGRDSFSIVIEAYKCQRIVMNTLTSLSSEKSQTAVPALPDEKYFLSCEMEIFLFHLVDPERSWSAIWRDLLKRARTEGPLVTGMLDRPGFLDSPLWEHF